MSDPLLWHRLQFAFTIVFHYLFPQLTMGLALLIVADEGARPPHRRPTGGTTRRASGSASSASTSRSASSPASRWSSSSAPTGRASRRYAGGVIGQTLAMEGLFAFFLESSFLGLLVFGERRLGRRGHFLAALALFVGSWLSGYFIICTNAFMQHPVGHAVAADGTLVLADFWAFLLNPWALAQYAHTMAASVVTASFVVAAVGAYYALQGLHPDHAPRFLRVGRRRGSRRRACWSRSRRATSRRKLVARHQPVALAAMEGRFESEARRRHRDDRPAERRRSGGSTTRSSSPGSSASSPTGRSTATCKGLNEFPEDLWPDNIELLYYAFHIMAGLGTLFILVMGLAALLLLRGTLARSRPDALDAHARVSVPVHRHHHRLDDGRARPPAVARLRPHAHRGRREPQGALRHGAVHADRLHRPLPGPGRAVPLPDRARDRPRTGPARRPAAGDGRACAGRGARG